MQLQVVIAFVDGLVPLEYREREVVLNAFRNATKRMKCYLVNYRFGERWMELILDHSPGFDISKLMRCFKAVSSRNIHTLRGNASGIWAPGYVVRTIGEPVEPEAVFQSLLTVGSDL